MQAVVPKMGGFAKLIMPITYLFVTVSVVMVCLKVQKAVMMGISLMAMAVMPCVMLSLVGYVQSL